jgi:hypothetical protein
MVILVALYLYINKPASTIAKLITWFNEWYEPKDKISNLITWFKEWFKYTIDIIYSTYLFILKNMYLINKKIIKEMIKFFINLHRTKL